MTWRHLKTIFVIHDSAWPNIKEVNVSAHLTVKVHYTLVFILADSSMKARFFSEMSQHIALAGSEGSQEPTNS